MIGPAPTPQPRRQPPSSAPASLAPYRDRKYFRVGEDVFELDQLVVSDQEWPRLPESAETGWTLFRRDGYVFASRILA